MIKQYKLRFYNFRLVIFLLAISFIGIQLVGTAADYRCGLYADPFTDGLFLAAEFSMDHVWI